MSNIGEFGLIERISAQFRDNQLSTGGVLGIGDDCAVLPQREGLDTLVTTDLLIEDRHFLLGDISPWQLGWKSAAVNISDIAAMGGLPEGTFLSIALPKEFPSREGPLPLSDWVDAFLGGFKALSGRFGVPLLGGDTSASPDKLFINVTVLGSCPHGAAILRSGARVGDLICVTGTLGDAAAGLKLILERASAASGGYSGAAQALIRRHYEPVPRVAEGIALRERGCVHSMMDISDGIASDLRHILKGSGGGQPLGAVIDLGSLPLSDEFRLLCSERGWEPYELAVSGGEDYELLFTLGPEALDNARQAVGELSVIGRITEGPDIRWEGGLQQDYQGFTHF